MDFVILIGRVLFAVLFLINAVGHFTNTRALAGYAQSKGVPAPAVATIAGGVLLGLGGLMILLGVWADLGALLLVVFVLPTAVVMHPYWKETDPQTRHMEQIQFFKDLALAGAALALLGLFVRFGHQVGLMLTGPLFG